MKFKISIILFFFNLILLFPSTVHATGEGNIDSGGGGLGSGTSTNYWSSGDEGVRVTVVRSSDGSAVSPSIDLTNKKPNDIAIHFGKISKSTYKNGAGLSPKTSVYSYINPAQSLPRIISSSSGGANLIAIKRYFTDEQVIKNIAGYVGISFKQSDTGRGCRIFRYWHQ